MSGLPVGSTRAARPGGRPWPGCSAPACPPGTSPGSSGGRSPTPGRFARDLAESVVVLVQRDEAHWPDMAEVFIGGVAAAVLNFSPPERCHLLTVGNILADRRLLDETVEALRASAAWDGALARLGHVMTHAGKEGLESILSTSNWMLRWMSSPAAAASLKASSFDPADLTRGRCTVYLIVPAVHLRPTAGLVRLWLSALHRAVIRGGVRP